MPDKSDALSAQVQKEGGWSRLLELPLGSPSPLQEYVSSKVHVQDASGKGRGLFPKLDLTPS